MTPEKRLEISAKALIEHNPDHIDSIADISAKDLAKISADMNLKEDDFPKIIGVMIYIRKRLVEKVSRAKAFEAAFPERSVATENDKVCTEFGKTAKPGERLHTTTLNVKAKRLEASPLYTHVYQLLQLNLYINYAVDRMRILDEAFSISLDPSVPTRDRAQYMKLFLEETRKPENAKGLEVNLNLTQNNVSIKTVEDKMNTIAQAVSHATAGEVIDALYTKGDDNGDNS